MQNKCFHKLFFFRILYDFDIIVININNLGKVGRLKNN